MPEQKRTARGVLGGLLGFVGLSVAAGVLVTATVTPALAVTGITTNSAISVFDSLPEYLKINPAMEKSNIYATNADGSVSLLASFYDQNREEVEWDEISQYLKDAAVATEDRRFYEHGGVDITGTLRALISNQLGGDTQGASSITQQYVKNVQIQECERTADTEEEEDQCYTEAAGQDYARKLKEARYAIGLEKTYSKNEILRGYLNISGFGGTVYGVESAAQYYFGVSAKDVTLAQAATLIGMVQNPNSYRIDRDTDSNNADNGYEKTLKRRNVVLYAMLDTGKITQEQYDKAKAEEITPNITQPATGCSSNQTYAYFCDYVTNVILNDEQFGDTYDERRATLRQGGLDIYTTVNTQLQENAYTEMHNRVPASSDALDIGSTAVTVEPGTGRILAMVQNKYYSNDTSAGADYTSVNYNTDYAYGGSSGFQAGSTWKLFTLIQWLNEGRSINETVNGVKRTFNMTDSCGEGGGAWTDLKNSGDGGGGAGGNWTVAYGTAHSTNTVFAAMAEQMDICDIKAAAESLGAHRADGNDIQTYNPTILGTNEVAPLTMALAYAAVAANGLYCAPQAIDRVVLADGTDMDLKGADCTQAIDENVAATAIYALEGVMTGGGTGAAGNPYDGVPIFGKTGTTNAYKDSWLIGSTTKTTTAVWVGNVQGDTSLYYSYLNGTQGSRLKYGLFSSVQGYTDSLYGGDAFPDPDSNLTKRVLKDVPDVTGKSVSDAEAALKAQGFNTAVSDQQVDSDIEAGLVAQTDPAGGAQVASGSTVTIYVSTGKSPGTEVPDVTGKKQDDAEQTLSDSGFSNVKVSDKCTDTDDGSKKGTVAAQSPGAGETASKDDTITLKLYC